ncbi:MULTISPECIES: winged helix DNA-binding protein [Paraglaciecola]|uniref:winged helix DNA-binding protein n=1 Tax=Paraglaciecola TaxID=1621534 RepID=UPI00105C411C|nr:winged helix DNA-binding protein [Paraglaciecola marina]
MTSQRKIVSSKSLAEGVAWPLSEVELGLTVFYNAFTKWIVRCASAAGVSDLSPLDIMTLHNIQSRENQQRRIDICFMLNIEDTHSINYALKKLLKSELIEGEKRGKEMYYSATAKGRKLCEEYRKIREECLVSSLGLTGKDAEDLSNVAATLRSLSGVYDQAARAAASL